MPNNAPTSEYPAQHLKAVAPISLPSDARLPAYSTKCCHNSLPYMDAKANSSPTNSSPPTSPLDGKDRSMGHVDLNENPAATQSPEHLTRRLASAFFAYFLCGWGDGVTGAVLPHFSRDFRLNYMTASVVFATSTLGFAIGTLSLELAIGVLGRIYVYAEKSTFLPALPLFSFFHRKFGVTGATGHSKSQARFLILILYSVLHGCFFVIMGTSRGYGTLLFAYACAAFARSFLTSTLNAYASSTPKKPHGHLLGCWSLGGFASPLVCQTLIAKGVPWRNFYLGSLIVSTLNMCFLAYAFRPTQKEFESDLRSARQVVDAIHPHLGLCNDLPVVVGTKSSSSSIISVEGPTPGKTLKRTLSMPFQWILSIFAWIHSGNETTTQGFMITYLLVVRHANPKTVGYVISGYSAGQAISRFIWGHYTPILTFTQRKHIIHACLGSYLPQRPNSNLMTGLGCMLVMNLLIWFVHSNVENAFSTAFLGFVSGPLFPGTLRLANDVLPRDVHMISMAIISSFASFGSALFPFITGTISNARGVHSLTYVTVAQTGVLFCLWALFPSKKTSKIVRA